MGCGFESRLVTGNYPEQAARRARGLTGVVRDSVPQDGGGVV